MAHHEGGSITCTVVSGIDVLESSQTLWAIFQCKKTVGHREAKWPHKEANVGDATWQLTGFPQQVNGMNMEEVRENGLFSCSETKETLVNAICGFSLDLDSKTILQGIVNPITVFQR